MSIRREVGLVLQILMSADGVLMLAMPSFEETPA